MKLKFSILFVALTSLFILIWLGCSTAPTGTPFTNKSPETFITNVPPGQDTIPAVTLVYWYGIDYDGFVSYYEWALSGDSVDPSAITTWDSIFATDDTMKLTVDDVDTSTIVLDTIIDTVIVLPDTFIDTTIVWHFKGYFYVRAYDNEGLVDPSPAIRGWDVYSIKPIIEIAAPDTSSGLLNYIEGTELVFFPKEDIPVVFVLDDTTALWKGLQVWWNRKDTLNPIGNMAIGYRYKIDNNAWSTWTDENPATENDSFLTFTGPFVDGYHTFYLQGRNYSHIESDIDSLIFRTIKPDVEDGDIIVAIESRLTLMFTKSWYENFFNVLRPSANIRFIEDTSTVTSMVNLDSLKSASLIIYINEDWSTTVIGIQNAPVTLIKYIQVGGKVWTFGRNIYEFVVATEIGEQFMNEYMGIEYYEKSANFDFYGTSPTNDAINLGLPSDTLYIETSHIIPSQADSLIKSVENLRSSDPRISVLYKWVGTSAQYNETPVGILFQDQTTGLQTAAFGFPGRAMDWDSTTYEPLLTVYDEMLIWFGL